MGYMVWEAGVEKVQKHVVRILTPVGSGTGFLVSMSDDKSVCGVATAAHVVSRAHFWEQPIRIEHKSSGTTRLLRPSERAIFPDYSKDTAGIVFQREEIAFPDATLPLAPQGKYLKVGIEIAWVGFPAVAPEDMCFFSGRVSHYRDGMGTYLVDGVAINGVSGGPAFWNGGDRITLIGVLSAYIANRATGETLPGVSVVTSVEPFHGLSKAVKNVDEAKRKERPPEPPAQQPEAPDASSNQSRKKPRTN